MSNIEARARREREPPWLFELCAPRTILLLVGGCGAFVRFLVMSDGMWSCWRGSTPRCRDVKSSLGKLRVNAL